MPESNQNTLEVQMTKLSTTMGLSPILGERLESIGITSAETLLEVGATPAGRREIVRQTEIASDLVLHFVGCADLMRVEGIGPEYAELLQVSGVDTVPELSLRNPKHLADRLGEETW